MYAFFHGILSDKKGGIVFSCFGIWHLCYIFVVIVIAVLTFFCLQKKDNGVKKETIRAFINVSFGLYIADFFLMPLAFGEIDIEKLPFHVCTAMCVMCFLSNRTRALEKYQMHFALLGFVSNLIYLLYPAGVMWCQVHPLSYRVIQTLLFHGFMTLYGLFALMFGDQKLEWKTCYRDLGVIVSMALWALIGNTIYNGQAGNYSHNFNWFFVTQDPFYLLPRTVAPYVMPFLNITAFFAVELLVYAIYFGVKKLSIRRHQIKRELKVQ